ncbi:uncharacterized protein LOC101737648 [Bombyx mori]|uniref:C3H1-type domain-containing protein n=1 Tax=Bombyx mori TaxID=7091 RepID=A0A8R1WMF3_BOMMO|nr:uncharacterized protein LOC101737648 [Bombyx mori]
MKDEWERNDAVDVSNGVSWSWEQYWSTVLHQYGVPFMQFWISFFYGLYTHFTFTALALYFVKYVPTAIYMYTLVKNIYLTSRERIKRKQNELQDIQLQIQIVNTKLCVRDAEFTERTEQLRRDAERLRRVRARVRDVIATDEALRRTLEGAAWDNDHDALSHSTPQENREFLIRLLKEMKCDQVNVSERQPGKMDCGEQLPNESPSPENSIYSSLSDGDLRQDCRVKIVNVTNVYKVAYLKHYIKQKRLRRANRHAMIKKKMESVKKLLEDWQNTLSMVINSELTILNIDTHSADVASRKARGDYTKPNDSSDSGDSDLRNSSSDLNSEYAANWTQENKASPCIYTGDLLDTAECDFQQYGDVCSHSSQCEYSSHVTRPALLSMMPAEPGRLLTIEEVKKENEYDEECSDNIAI